MACTEIVWLDAERIEELNKLVLFDGENHGLNPGSDLKGAASRPRGQYHFGELETPFELAAMHAVAIAKAHAFQDGNKRTAVATVRGFLKVNGFDFDFAPHEDEALQMMEDIATDAVDLDEITEWISRNTVAASG